MSSNFESEFYRCSVEYIDRIDGSIRKDIMFAIDRLPKRRFQNQINSDLVWLLSSRGWAFSSFPSKFPSKPPNELQLEGFTKEKIERSRRKEDCLITSNLALDWYADFGKSFDSKSILVEVQFGKIEAAFRDFCRFAITYHERRMDLGILVVIFQPKEYFSEEGSRVSGMADFETVKNAIWAVDLNCPIWLIGLREPLADRQLTL